jgi:hypothetical protein
MRTGSKLDKITAIINVAIFEFAGWFCVFTGCELTFSYSSYLGILIIVPGMFTVILASIFAYYSYKLSWKKKE